MGRYLYFAGAVAESRRIAFSIANACEASGDEESHGHARPVKAPSAITLTGQV